MNFKLYAVILVLNFLVSNINGQINSNNDCYTVKYLDFFGLNNIEIVKWPDTEIDGLLKMNINESFTDTAIKTNFLIPIIAHQLKQYYPKCNTKIDTQYFEKLVLIFCKIRDIEPYILKSKTIEEQVDYIRDDFYSQVTNDKYLPHMGYTVDYGPFYGVDLVKCDSLEKLSSKKTDFGEIVICKRNDKIILQYYDNNKKLLWQKIVTKGSDIYFRDLYFADNAFTNTSVATIISMYSEGRRFTLYVKNDGKFMYYFHSW